MPRALIKGEGLAFQCEEGIFLSSKLWDMETHDLLPIVVQVGILVKSKFWCILTLSNASGA